MLEKVFQQIYYAVIHSQVLAYHYTKSQDLENTLHRENNGENCVEIFEHIVIAIKTRIMMLKESKKRTNIVFLNICYLFIFT